MGETFTKCRFPIHSHNLKRADSLALQNGNVGMIINPLGHWAELTREEVAQLVGSAFG